MWITGSMPVIRTASRRFVVPMMFVVMVWTGELKEVST